MRGGAVAGGSPITVEAGLHALRLGGNAVDAAVAAQLMACVAEPALTGLGGSGIATIRVGGEVLVCDLFSDFPRRGPPLKPMWECPVHFGPTTQMFHSGPGAVAVPGVPGGLWAMHERFGRVPMPLLAAPAAAAARAGVTMLSTHAIVFRVLHKVLSSTPEIAALFCPDGAPLIAGSLYKNADLANTLERFAVEGPEPFYRGDIARALLATLGDEGNLSLDDLAGWRPQLRPALALKYRDATVYMPGPPSQGGVLTLRALRELERAGPLPSPDTAEHVRRLAEAMSAAEQAKESPWPEALFSEGLVTRYVGPGLTTHISTVDAEGDAVAITTSLGETAGVVVRGTGVVLNNLLGEADVNPPDYPRPPGARLMTMCTPTLVDSPQGRFALGTGGSSRIRSALLHGVVHLVDHGRSPAAATAAPRCHMEAGELAIELADRPEGAEAALREVFSNLVPFGERALYFGGLHIAARTAEGFAGAGDPRRSGSFGLLSMS